MKKTNAKLAVRVSILAVGLVISFVAANLQPIFVADGGPIPLCDPRDKSCIKQNMPPVVADGGPIPLCDPRDKSCIKQNMPPLVADGGPIPLCDPRDKRCIKQNMPPIS
jgi:hypothetical protein